MLVRHLQDRTSPRLAVINHRSSICEAALGLCTPGIGLLVVCDDAGHAQGVLSKSDLVRHLATGHSSDQALQALMSPAMIACAPADDLQAVWKIMMARRLQNIPVLVEGTTPVGILDVRDAMQALFDEEARLEAMLSNYIIGIGYR
jgi:CBS domain-containing protein